MFSVSGEMKCPNGHRECPKGRFDSEKGARKKGYVLYGIRYALTEYVSYFWKTGRFPRFSYEVPDVLSQAR